MKETIVIAKAVGRNATNRSQDVTKVQNRLNKWIAFGASQGSTCCPSMVCVAPRPNGPSAPSKCATWQ